MKQYYVVDWSEEYISAAIIAGPMGYDDAVERMKTYIFERLIELNIAATPEAAQEMYKEAKENFEGDPLSVCPESVSIRVGDYDEYVQIVAAPENSAANV